MDIILLGTGADVPRHERPLTAMGLRMGRAVYLLDCGEGTQLALAAQHVGLGGLRLVAIPHLHAEQFLGLPGLLARRSQVADAGPLTVVGPHGLEALVMPLLRGLAVRVPYELRFVEVGGDAPAKKAPMPVAWADDLLELRTLPLDHTVPTLGFRLVEHPRPGKFSAAAARARGLTPGPDFGRLQAGESVRAPDGSEVLPDDVVGDPRSGRGVAYVSDTAACPGLYRLLDDVDLAVVGGGWLPEYQAVAKAKKQLSLRDAARVCSRAGARRARFTQLSPRLPDERLDEADALVAELHEHYRVGRVGDREGVVARD